MTSAVAWVGAAVAPTAGPWVPTRTAVSGSPGASVAEDARRAVSAYEDFDAFVHARLGALTRFARVLTRTPEAADDLVQESLERTLLHWASIRERANPDAYVRRVMVNRNISTWRRTRHETPVESLPERDAPPGSDAPRDDELLAAVRALPPRQRTVLVLRYYEDLTEAQVAELMGCSVGTVKSQASKAIAKLRLRSADFSDRVPVADRDPGVPR